MNIERAVTGCNPAALVKSRRAPHNSHLGTLKRCRQHEQLPRLARCDDMSTGCHGRAQEKQQAADASL